MSTKPHKPEPDAAPEVVVENLRAAVYASHAELSAQVQAELARRRIALVFATRAPILPALLYGLLSLR